MNSPSPIHAAGREAGTTYCPATMCPLFAAEGSPWTGTKNDPCDHEQCGWWQGFGGKHCDGASSAIQQIVELSIRGKPLVIAKTYHNRQVAGTAYDCNRAGECQWQCQADETTNNLCPPRFALFLGLDPRSAAY